LVKQSATPVASVTMLGICKQDILRLGGIWPPVGTTQRTDTETYNVNALPAICTNKDGNGLSVEDLTRLSKDELRALCKQQDARERMEWQSFDKWWTTIEKKPLSRWRRSVESLSAKQRQQLIDELRSERWRLMFTEFYNVTNTNRLKAVAQKLYDLTGHEGYYWR
jgi:hypothetical protein